MARFITDDEWDPDAEEDDDRDSPRLSPAVQAQLGRRLRDFYAALALGEQPVPQHFIDLIYRLDQGQPPSGRDKH
jgi:hypothetical protein